MKLKLFLFFIFLKLCLDSKKIVHKIQEGFECNYRKKENGKMCNEKWGEPKCNDWKKNKKMKKYETLPHTNILKGYYSNPYMYEIDYETEEDSLLIPKGVHSSFFS
tara:strand:+ start:14 stop:331 length:318 start_codon:yes stop_codon:yes gene_type:complete